MSFILISHTIRKHLIRSFAVLDGWFDSDPDVLNFKVDGESTITALMRCITLNNDHLLQIPNVDEAGTKGNAFQYNLDLAELEYAARHWQRPPDEEGDFDLNELRSRLRMQLDISLIILERAENHSTETYHPLTSAEDGSWDGFHRLYFMGLLMRQYTRRFGQIAEYCNDALIPGQRF
jgi:hypothetical protein